MAKLPPLSIGYVSLIGLLLIAPTSAFVAPYGARLAHRMPKRKLELAFGVFPAASEPAVPLVDRGVRVRTGGPPPLPSC